MPRILILHASLGTGHLSAARALEAAFGRTPGVEVQVSDLLDHTGAVLRTASTEAYKRMSEKTPLLYRLLYESSDTADAEESIAGNVFLSRLERPFLGQLGQFIDQVAPDALVCVHPIAAHMADHYRRDDRLPQPFYVVVTDFMAHSTWLAAGAAGYFLPGDLTRDVLIARRVDPALLHVTGIPVALEIDEPKSTAVTRVRHQLPTDAPVIALFGGGIDPDRVRLMVTRLLDSPTAATLVVVAGRNEELLDTIDDLTDGPHMALRKLGLIDHVDDLVVASDLVITKSGGLIVSEVLARGTPLVIIDPIPGQEEWNADFVAGSGAGIQLRMPETVPSTILGLLAQPERLATLRAQARLAGRPRAALDVAERVLANLGVAVPAAASA